MKLVSSPLYVKGGSAYRAAWPVDYSMDPRLTFIGYDGPDHLNIASGVNPIPGAVNVDLQAFGAVQLTFDFRKPWPIEDATYDKVTMFECLEHVSPVEAFAAVCEARRVLRPNGLLIIETPDIVKCCQAVLDGNVGVIGGGMFGGWDAPPDHHLYGYTTHSLALLCHVAGFLRLVTGPGKDYHAVQIPTVRVEAVKSATRDLKESG